MIYCLLFYIQRNQYKYYAYICYIFLYVYLCKAWRWLNMSRNMKLWLCFIIYSCVWRLFIGVLNLKLAREPNPQAERKNVYWLHMLFSRQPVVFFEPKVTIEWLTLLTGGGGGGGGGGVSYSKISTRRSSKFIGFFVVFLIRSTEMPL